MLDASVRGIVTARVEERDYTLSGRILVRRMSLTGLL